MKRTWPSEDWIKRLFATNRRRPQRGTHSTRWRPRLEPLEDRLAPAITTSFSSGILTLTGDAAPDTIGITADAAGNLLLNGATITSNPTVANTTRIDVNAGDGNDLITIDSATMIATHLNGEGGHDTLVGGSGVDSLDGGLDADSLTGGAGNDRSIGTGALNFLAGGPGNDTIYGGASDDTLDGGSGNDRLYGGTGFDLLYGRSGRDLCRKGEQPFSCESR